MSDTDDTIHDATHLEAIAKVMKAMQALDVELDAVGCWHKGEVEVWAGDGYRLGFVFYGDDHWQFRIDYTELETPKFPTGAAL